VLLRTFVACIYFQKSPNSEEIIVKKVKEENHLVLVFFLIDSAKYET